MAPTTITLEKLTQRVKNYLEIKGKVVFFLGAGCSKSSGIPLASEIVSKLQEEGKASSEHQSYTSALMDAFPSQRARSHFFRELCGKATPSRGYKHLADMVHYPAIPLIVTTNFDDLVEQSLRQQSRKYSILDPFSSPMARTTANESLVSVMKLHGDLNSQTLNTFEETDNVKIEQFLPLAKQTFSSNVLLVFVGYGGNDHGVARWLEQLEVQESTVYWCGSSFPENNSIAPWLRSKKACHVQERDFDTIFVSLSTFS